METQEIKDHVKESGHWYHKDGSPAYTIVGKNGNERPTTLRDARKLGLVPSVTTIIGCADKPQLTNWKIDQAILSALTLGRMEEETEKEYVDRIKEDAKEQAKKAAERGTQIHAWVQNGFELWEAQQSIPEEQFKYFNSAYSRLVDECGSQEWSCEKPFATKRYGGKCDLHNDNYLLDFKTTDKPITDLKLWESHFMQLAAYREGLKLKAQCGILWINSVTAESCLVWAEEKDLEKGLKMFNALLDFWYSKTGLEA